MEKLYKKPLAALLLTLLALGAQAQVTLEHTFQTEIWNPVYALPEAGMYFTVQKEVHQTEDYTEERSTGYILYNSDFSVYRIFSYAELGGWLYHRDDESYIEPLRVRVCVSKHIFNDDNLLEFIVSYREENTNVQYIRVVNENGEVILSSDGASGCHLAVIDNQLKFITTSYSSSNTITRVYSLPGSPEAISLIQQDAILAPAYPNPSSSTIALPYSLQAGQQATMMIRDMAGRTIEEKRIDSHFDRIMLNVSSYTPGTYLYTVNGQTRKFVVSR